MSDQIKSIDYHVVKDFWESRASLYGKKDVRSLTVPWDDPELLEQRDTMERNALEPLLPKRKITRLLEMGCGTGRWTSFLAQKADHVVAFDIASGLIEIAKKETKKANIENVEFHIGDARKFCLAEKFDVITAFGVTIYLDNAGLSEFAQNVSQMLTDDGVLIQKDPLSYTERKVENQWYGQPDTDYCCIYRIQNEYDTVFSQVSLELAQKFSVFKDDDLQVGLEILTWKKNKLNMQQT